jgi:hypothetical protein
VPGLCPLSWVAGIINRHQGQPRFGSALEREHAGDAVASQEQRRTGAGGFVWSTAEENDITIPRNLPVTYSEILDRDFQRAWKRNGIGNRTTSNIDDQHILAGSKFVA